MRVAVACRRTSGIWLWIPIVGAFLSGCSEDSSDAKSMPTRTVSSPQHDPGATRSSGALIAYQAMWDDLAKAAATSDPKHPSLGDHATGGALQLLRYMMKQDRRDHVITRGRFRIAPVVMNDGDTKVVIRDCVDSVDWLHYTTEGRLEDKVPGGHHRVDATVRVRGGVWRVERMYIGQVGTC